MTNSINNITHEFILINNIRMHVVTAGPVDGPLLLLLHGFPEFWYAWRHQIPVLAQAGYRVVVPDQRGYNTTAKTPPYDLLTLTDDIVALITHFGREKSTIIGHDWGGTVAWYLAARRPELVDNLIILNVPHGLAFYKALRGSFKQMLKSWYVFAFQIKGCAWLISKTNYKFLEAMVTKSAQAGLFEADLDHYRAAWAQPGAIAAMVGWYKTLFESRPPSHSNASTSAKTRAAIDMPVLLIWGDADRFIVSLNELYEYTLAKVPLYNC